MSLIDLKHAFPFAVNTRTVPQDSHGWLDERHKQVFKKIITPDVHLFVELGVWLGKTTRFIAETYPQMEIVSIDHWQGSPEHANMPEVRDKLPTLYETFIANTFAYRQRVNPLRMNTVQGLKQLAMFDVDPDMFYVDAGHDTISVLEDLETIHALFPDAIIMGDDYSWRESGTKIKPVREAVRRFCDKYKLKFELPKLPTMTNMTCYQIFQGTI